MSFNLFCFLGIHSFGEWEYLRSDDCHMVRTCVRCHVEEKSIWAQHDFSEWAYILPDKCDQRRVCKRCGRQEEGEGHTYGPKTVTSGSDSYESVLSEAHGSPTYVQTGMRYWTETSRTCSRCGIVDASVESEDVPGEVIAY